MALIELSPTFITDFEIYLTSEVKLTHNTVWLYMIPLKKMIAIAIKNRWLIYNPFDDYKIKCKETDVSCLTIEEIEVLMNLPLVRKKHEIIRDLFIFCCFTELSFCDMKNLKSDNLQIFFDDEPWIITRQQKTDVSSNVPLLDIPLKIIEKYWGMTKDDHLLPAPSYSTLEIGIKKIAAAAGIKKTVTWHTSRHTYATEICLSNGVPIETFSKTMGHKFISTTQRYAKVKNPKVRRDMGKLNSIKQFRDLLEKI
jgi:integrase